MPRDLVREIVVVDFDFQHEFSAVARQYAEMKTIRHVHVPQTRYFNKSAAINIGATQATLDSLLICDADVCLTQETLTAFSIGVKHGWAMSPKYVTESSDYTHRPAPGIVCVDKQDFVGIKGYCSEFQGWGFEDHDFLVRLKRSGVVVTYSGSGNHTSHDDAERVANYYSPDRLQMRETNLLLYEKRMSSNEAAGTLLKDRDILPE
jgi:hypothetical protein